MGSRALYRGFLAVIAPCCIAADQQMPVDLCKVLRDPESFHENTITIRASYRYADEIQQIYCLGCAEISIIYPSSLAVAYIRIF